MLLWLWTSCGLSIVMLLLFRNLEARGPKQRLAAVLLLVLFSGMDVLGAIFNHNLGALLRPSVGHPSGPHLEWWAGSYQFSSNTTLLFWVFN